MTYTIAPPASDEYAPFAATYVQRVPHRNIVVQLQEQVVALQQLLAGVNETNAAYRPGPKEWSIKEVVGHLNDCERVFVYRATCFARNDPAPLPGFDQDDYVREANYDARPLADLLNEWLALRQATSYAFAAITPAISERRGTANNVPTSVRALMYITVGHTDVHLESLRTEYGLPRA